MAGDPDRVKYIAETYLENPKLVNERRHAYCYTGTYQGVALSVMATGMGNPSMMIYATELFREYGCEAIIRIGTSGGYLPEMRRHEVVMSQAACHTSSINDNIFNGTFCPIADYGLLTRADAVAKARGIKTYVGNTVCNDLYYRLSDTYQAAAWRQYGIISSEMEGAGLYTAAAQFGKKALMLVTILCYIGLDEQGMETARILPEEEGRSLDDAILIALETAAGFARDNGYASL